MRVQRSIEIASPPEKIWPFLIEPDKILKWCTTFKKLEYTGEQRGTGTTIYIEEKAGPTPLMKLNFTATEWVENERLALNMVSGTGVKRYELRWTLEPTPSGSTFTFMENFALPFGIVGKLICAVGQRTSENHVREFLAKLKNLVEL